MYIQTNEWKDKTIYPRHTSYARGINIALVKVLFSIQKYSYFSYFSTKTYVVGTHQKHLAEALLLSTHNICFCGEIRKIFTRYPPLSRPMYKYIIIFLIWRGMAREINL